MNISLSSGVKTDFISIVTSLFPIFIIFSPVLNPFTERITAPSFPSFILSMEKSVFLNESIIFSLDTPVICKVTVSPILISFAESAKDNVIKRMTNIFFIMTSFS